MSKIRTELNHDETFIDEPEPIKLFLGNCCGIGLNKRGPKDKHITFHYLCEDDLNWFYKDGRNGMSSHWMLEAQKVLRAAIKWCKENAEPDMYNGKQYGWKFKK